MKDVEQNYVYRIWMRSAKPLETLQVNHDTTRDVYRLPCGLKAYDHWVSPHNFLKKSYSYTVLDLTVEANDRNRQLVESYGGSLDKGWYTDEGFAVPVFHHPMDSLAVAFEFCQNEMQWIRTYLNKQ